LLRALRSTFARSFSFSTMLAGLLVTLLFFLFLGRNIFSDPDLWWHLRDARYLVTSHAMIHGDMYSFTATGNPWINSEWLSELPFYLAWERFGPRGLFLLTIMLIEAVTLGVCLLCFQQTRNIKPALIASGLFILMMSVSMGPRTVMFGWLCLIAEIYLLRAFAGGRDRLWLLPFLFCLWINLHGTWPIGVVYLLLFVGCGLREGSWGSIASTAWSSAQRIRLYCITGLSAIALFLNPYGWRLVTFPFQMIFAHKLMIENVEEWQSLNFHVFRGKVTFVVIAGLLIANIVRRRGWRLNEFVFLLIAILSALTYTRLLVLAGIALSPWIAVELDLFEPYDAKADKPWMNLAVVLILASIVFSQIPKLPELNKQIAEACPLKSVQYMETVQLSGRIMNELSWGGYLEWNQPQAQFFIDSRSELFDPAGVLQDYIDATGVRHTLQLLDKYEIRYVLFPKNDPIVYLLTRTTGWVTKYSDDQAILLERNLPN
jgi:hypothetical protein